MPKKGLSVYDLRAGNKVKCKISNDNGIYTVMGLDALNLRVSLSAPRNIWHPITDIKPISLTEKWLSDFELKVYTSKKGVRYIELNEVMNLIIIDDSRNKIYLALSLEDNLYDLQTRIYNVHELQNIFKEIAKFELKTIK